MNIQTEKIQKDIGSESINLIFPIGLISFQEGILALYDFFGERVVLEQLGITEVKDFGFFLRISDKNNTYNFGIALDKIFEFLNNNKKLNDLKIGLYKFKGYGNFFEPLWGFSLSSEYIYELRGLIKALSQKIF